MANKHALGRKFNNLNEMCNRKHVLSPPPTLSFLGGLCVHVCFVVCCWAWGGFFLGLRVRPPPSFVCQGSSWKLRQMLVLFDRCMVFFQFYSPYFLAICARCYTHKSADHVSNCDHIEPDRQTRMHATRLYPKVLI